MYISFVNYELCKCAHSPYQTHCPQMRIFALQWSLHGVYATARAWRYYVSQSQINMGDRPKRMSCPPRYFVEEFCQLREKKDEESKTKTQNRHGVVWCWGCWIGYVAKTAKKSISWDSITNTMSGVITIMKGITFPSFAWKKCFSPSKVRWRIEATFFTSNCIVASRLWSGRKDDPEVRIELNVEPLKCYKLKNCRNK